MTYELYVKKKSNIGICYLKKRKASAITKRSGWGLRRTKALCVPVANSDAETGQVRAGHVMFYDRMGFNMWICCRGVTWVRKYCLGSVVTIRTPNGLSNPGIRQVREGFPQLWDQESIGWTCLHRNVYSFLYSFSLNEHPGSKYCVSGMCANRWGQAPTELSDLD